MNQPRRGLAITDLLAIGAVLVLIAALGMPTLERARELSKRSVCAINLKNIGGAAEVYADANKGQWMTPPFRQSAVNTEGIAYLCSNGLSNPYSTFVCVGFLRDYQSQSQTLPSPAAGTTALSTTRAYWMLVRFGDVSVKQFICPSSEHDVSDPTEQIDSYYDFQNYRNISYGYLVPFGPIETRPRQGKDHRMVFAADKGPFYLDNYQPDFGAAGPTGGPVRVTDPPQYWRPFNSPNHGGLGTGEGQNALFADGRVEFHRIPAIGVDNDNIYTVIVDYWSALPFNRLHGDSPHTSAQPNPYAGQGAYGSSPTDYATTDSVIYP